MHIRQYIMSFNFITYSMSEETMSVFGKHLCYMCMTLLTSIIYERLKNGSCSQAGSWSLALFFQLQFNQRARKWITMKNKNKIHIEKGENVGFTVLPDEIVIKEVTIEDCLYHSRNPSCVIINAVIIIRIQNCHYRRGKLIPLVFDIFLTYPMNIVRFSHISIYPIADVQPSVCSAQIEEKYVLSIIQHY